MSTLHDQLEAAIKERLAVAQAATPGPWERREDAIVGGDVSGLGVPNVVSSMGYEGPQEVADLAHVAANGPDRIIRDCERDLKVLARHRPMIGDPRWCVWCTRESGIESVTPCVEIRDLAEAYGHQGAPSTSEQPGGTP